MSLILAAGQKGPLVSAPLGSAEFREQSKPSVKLSSRALPSSLLPNGLMDFEFATLKAAEARRYIEAMFNQGMYVACLVVDSTDGTEMWLTAWEPPNEFLPWPLETTGRNELVHHGVQIAPSSDQVLGQREP